MSLIAGTWDLKTASPVAAEQRFKDENHEESVFEDLKDDRKLVPLAEFQNDDGKYRSIVKLFVRYAGQETDDKRYAMGTGWLIRDDLLVTAGHCAFDWSQNDGKGFGCATEVKAFIGYNGKDSVNQGALDNKVQFRHGVKIVTTQKWLDSGMFRQNDVSFIKLNKGFTGVTPFKFQDTPFHDRKTIGVVGYPGDKDYEGEKGAQMYEEFREVTWDRKESAKNMLEYRINTYRGQSGSPVILQGASEGSAQVSIGAHVYGSGGKNSASAIGELGNPYEKYISVFDKEFKEFKPLRIRQGVTYVDMNPLEESGFDEEEDFWQTMKSVMDVGAPIVGDALKMASPFFGPIGGPLAALAGTAIGAAGKKLAARGKTPGAENEFGDPKEQPSVVHQAIMNEACLHALFHSEVKSSKFREELNTKLIAEYRKRATAAERVSPKVLPAVMASVLPLFQDIVRQTLAAKPETDLGQSEVVTIQKPEAYERMKDSFAKRIIDAPSKQPVEESIWDVFGAVLSAANKGVSIVQKGLDVANTLLPPKTESSLDESTPLDADLTVLGKRAVLGAAAASVLQGASLDELQEEGLFIAIKDAAARYGPTVIKYGPVVIDALRPVVQAYADATTGGGSGGSPTGKTRDPESGKSMYERMYGKKKQDSSQDSFPKDTLYSMKESLNLDLEQKALLYNLDDPLYTVAGFQVPGEDSTSPA
ncbi:Peptidase S1B, glutamyl endopeptidase I [Penicillium italicum]|uniref:Serine protease n=1 Tax=Penicillium italicum TaxID=40296 RepID=A0A0A2L2P5_PENIT|nr:Peptidase S1B, glutamyl endopeptidase I [Penicillium italicum]